MNRLLKTFRLTIVLTIVSACVDPIAFDALPPGEVIVVDGNVTDDPGPYRINVTRGVSLNADSTVKAPVSGVKIVLHSDKGESESFTEARPGEYLTGGTIQGVIGASYYIDITMPDGSTFSSTPEKILPSGNIQEIRYEYEARTKQVKEQELPADVINVYIDADNAPGEEKSYVRWRFNGTYKLATNPELHETWLQGSFTYPTPWPCSGQEIEPLPGGGWGLVVKKPCTCCTCYVKEYEDSPHLSDDEFVSGGQFRNLKIVEVPINRKTFFEKYRVEIQQMTISKSTFDFYKVIRAQKDGASNLFQPSPGKVRGNINAVDANYNVIGQFWAASINRKVIYIKQTDLPYLLPVDIIPYPCNSIMPNTTTTKPDYWDE